MDDKPEKFELTEEEKRGASITKVIVYDKSPNLQIALLKTLRVGTMTVAYDPTKVTPDLEALKSSSLFDALQLVVLNPGAQLLGVPPEAAMNSEQMSAAEMELIVNPDGHYAVLAFYHYVDGSDVFLGVLYDNGSGQDVLLPPGVSKLFSPEDLVGKSLPEIRALVDERANAAVMQMVAELKNKVKDALSSELGDLDVASLLKKLAPNLGAGVAPENKHGRGGLSGGSSPDTGGFNFEG